MAKVRTYYTGPTAPAMADIFGLTGKMTKKGYKVTGREPGMEAPTLFGPEAFQQMGEYLTAGPGEATSALYGNVMSPQSLMGELAGIRETGAGITGALQEGLATGFETDIGPMVEAAKAQYMQDIIPQTIEDFIGTSGVSSSDFGAALAREGRRLATDIGAMGVGAKEAAAGRRAEILGQAPTLAGQVAAMPGLYAADILGLEQAMIEAQPGSKLLETFQSLVGQPTGAQTIVKPSGFEKFTGAMAGLSGLFGGAGSLGTGAADIAELFKKKE